MTNVPFIYSQTNY